MATTRKTANAGRRTSARKQSTRNASSENSITNGIRILRYAIKNKQSVSASAQENGRGRNYVSDIKARLEENYRSKNISRDQYNTFRSLNKQYEKIVK